MTVSARPLRVIHVIHGLGTGGAEALLFQLATTRSSVSHEIVSLTPPDWYSSHLDKQDIRVHYLGIVSAMSAMKAIPKLIRILKQSRAEVVQTWMYRSNVYAGIAARALRLPVVWGIHTATPHPLRFGARFWAYAGGLLARWLPSFVINCSYRGAETHAPMGYDRAPGMVVPNGYDPDRFFPDETARCKARDALGIIPGSFTLGFISRWAAEKDLQTLIRSLRLLRDRGIEFRALFVGAGLDPANSELAELLREGGCADVVALLGRRADIPDLGRAIDLHLLSSIREGFPNTVAETMLSGTPNVVTDVGDSALMVGKSGWVVPTRDPESLANAIEEAYREWAQRPDEWQWRRNEARRLIAERFTFERMVQAYEEIWWKVANLNA